MSATTLVRRTAITTLASAIVALPRTAAAQQQQAKPSLDEPTVVAIFDAANAWDIQTGSLAEKKGSTKAIRDFGAMLARDHKAVQAHGRALADSLGIEPTAPESFAMKKDHDAAMAKLQRLSGAAFDRAFLEHEVAYHKAVIDAVHSTLLPAIHTARLETLVTTVAPAFQAHELAAENLLKKLPAY